MKEKLGRLWRAIPYRRIISLILTMATFISILSPAVYAEAEADKKEAAMELLSGLADAIAEGLENAEEEESVSQEENGIVPDAVPSDTEAEDAVEEEKEEEEEPESDPFDVTAIRITTPDSTLRLAVDESGAIESEGSLSSLLDWDYSGRIIKNWEQFAPEQLVSLNDDGSLNESCILYWMLNNPDTECTQFENSDGKLINIYGISNYSTLVDSEDNDLLCDVCGYCLLGCVDGDEIYYTEDDIDHSLDADGKYFNSDGVLVAVDATITVETAVSEENTDTLVFMTYTVNSDGFCDECGKPIVCDGFCDVCGICMDGNCEDNEGGTPAPDGLCDLCGMPVHCAKCADGNSDGFCDACLFCMDGCIDETTAVTPEISQNEESPVENSPDGLCDKCGMSMPCSGEHSDENKDGICDLCLFCTDECKDAEGEIIHDNICDKCGHTMGAPVVCSHVDVIGSEGLCHMSGGELLMILESLIYMKAVVEDSGGWLERLISDAPPVEGDPFPGIGYICTVRQSIFQASQASKDLDDNLKMFQSPELYEALNGASIVGTPNSDGTLNPGDSLYGAWLNLFEQFEAEKEAAPDSIKPYYTVEEDAAEIPEAMKDAAKDVLVNELDMLFGSDYCGGELPITQENYLQYRGMVNAMESGPVLFLYDGKHLDSDVRSLAGEVWSGGASLPEDEGDRLCTLFAMLDDVRAKIVSSANDGFESFAQFTYDAFGTQPYAIRRAEKDSPVMLAEDYAVTDEKIQKIIRSIDGYLRSPEFVDVACILFDDLNKEDLKDMNGDGIINSYELLLHFMTTKLFTDEFVTNLLVSVFGAVTDALNSLPELLEGVEHITRTGYREYKIDVIALKTVGWLSKLLDVFATEVSPFLKFDTDYNGRVIPMRQVIDRAQLKIYPDTFVRVVQDHNKDGKYTGVINALRMAGSDWSNVETLPFGIDSADDIRDVIELILQSVDPLISIILSSNSGSGSRLFLDKLAAVDMNSSLLGIIPLFISLDVNPEFDFNPAGHYDGILIPIFEALGIAMSEEQYNPASLRSTADAAKAILDPMLKLLEQFSEQPLEKLLSILPNIAMYLQNNKLFDLLDLDIHYSLELKNMNARGADLSGAEKRIKDAIFKHWYDWINPLKYAKWLLAQVQLLLCKTIFSGLMGAIAKAFVDTDLKATIRSMNLNLKEPIGVLVMGLCNRISARINDRLSDKGMMFNWTVSRVPDVDLRTGDSTVQNLNLYNYLIKMLCSDQSMSCFGFRLDQPDSFIRFVLERLCYQDGAPMFDVNAVMATLDLDTLAHLGQLTVHSGSNRDSHYYSHWSGLLDQGEYLFVQADTSDVFFYLLKVIASFTGNKQNLSALLTLLGKDERSINAFLEQLDTDLKAQLGINLKSILQDKVDADGKLNLELISRSLTAENFLLSIVEFMLADGKYNLLDTLYASASDQRMQEVISSGSIPYLKYQNAWSKDIAKAMTEDIDDVINDLLVWLGRDLDPNTPERETIQQFLSNKLRGHILDNDLLTAAARISCEVYRQAEDQQEQFNTFYKLTGLDLSAYLNDFGYLFYDDCTRPTKRVFPTLSAEKKDNGKLAWMLNNDPVDTPEDVFNAISQLFSQLEPILDILLCGRDAELLTYTKKDGKLSERGVISVTGADGYDSTLLPLFEAILGEDADELPSVEEFREMGSGAGLARCCSALVMHLMKICLSDTIVSDLLEMLIQVMYAVSENGLSLFLINLPHPLLRMIDSMQPILNIDFDAIFNDVLCDLLYSDNRFDSPDEMRALLNTTDGKLKLRSLSVESLLKFLSVCLSVKDKDGNRLIPGFSKLYHNVIQDLACLRVPYDSQAYTTINGKVIPDRSQPLDAYRLKLDGADALTVMLSFVCEALLDDTNAQVLDILLKLEPGFFVQLRDLLRDKAKYTANYNWAYFAPGNESAILSSAKESPVNVNQYAHPLVKTYLDADNETPINEAETARTMVESLDDILTLLLNLNVSGKPLAEQLFDPSRLEKRDGRYSLGSIITGLVSDESLDTVLDKVANFFDSSRDMDIRQKDLAQLRETIRGLLPIIGKVLRMANIDLTMYSIDKSKTIYRDGKVIYCGTDGKPTGLTRPQLAADDSNLNEVLLSLLLPAKGILGFLLLGKPIDVFYSSDTYMDKDGNILLSRGDDLVSLSGVKLHDYTLLPLFESLGITGLKNSDAYIRYSNGGGKEYMTEEFLADFCSAFASWAQWLVSEPEGPDMLNKVIDLLPPLLYFINSNGIGVIVQNIIEPLSGLPSVLNRLREIMSKGEELEYRYTLDTVKELCSDLRLGTLLETLFSWVSIGNNGDRMVNGMQDIGSALLAMLRGVEADQAGKEGIHLTLTPDGKELLNSFVVGELVYNSDSECLFDTYSMHFVDSTDKATFLTVTVSFLLDLIEHPDNAKALSSVLGDGVYQAIINLMHLPEHDFKMKPYHWEMTEYADKDVLVSAFKLSKDMRNEPIYGDLWTREMSTMMAMNMERTLNNILYLLGVKIGDIVVRDFPSLMKALFGGALYTQRSMDAITKLLGGIKGYLDKYDPNGTIAPFIKELLGVDLHAWDAYAPGGVWANGRNWGFSSKDNMTEEQVERNAVIFENAICELLAPLAPLLTFVLADRDIAMLVDADGLPVRPDGDGKSKTDNRIQLIICGAEGYKHAIVPLFEAMHISSIPSPEEFSEKALQDPQYAVRGVIHPIISKVQELWSTNGQEFFEQLPGLIYFLNCGGLGVCIENLLHSIYVIGNALKPMKDQISALVYDEQGIFDLYNTLNVTALADQALFDMFGIEKSDLIRIYNLTGKDYSEADSFEDIDLRLLLSVVMALMDKTFNRLGVHFTVTPFVADITNELSLGYVRSFDSLCGEKAYTMVLDKELDPGCYGDFFTVMMRMALKLLAQGENVDAFVDLLAKLGNIDTDSFLPRLLKAVLRYVVGFMTSVPCVTESAMYAMYLLVWDATDVSYKAVAKYEKLNFSWAMAMSRLKMKDGGIPYAIVTVLMDVFDDEIGDILTPTQVAPNGFLPAITQAVQVVKTTVTTIVKAAKTVVSGIKSLFRR